MSFNQGVLDHSILCVVDKISLIKLKEILVRRHGLLGVHVLIQKTETHFAIALEAFPAWSMIAQSKMKIRFRRGLSFVITMQGNLACISNKWRGVSRRRDAWGGARGVGLQHLRTGTGTLGGSRTRYDHH